MSASHSSVSVDRRPRVVITGLGAVSPIGNTAEEFWHNLLAGVSGIKPITYFDTSQLPIHIAGEVRRFDPGQFMDIKDARRMSRGSQYAVAAACMARTDAGLDGYELDRDRTGVYLGTGGGGYDVSEMGIQTLFSRGYARLSPFVFGAAMPNAFSFNVALALRLYGYNSTVTTACAAGTQAIGEAAEVIRRGQADVMITGGSDCAVTHIGLAGFAQLRALSTRKCPPEEASRPFDGERDGLVVGEGCGVLILESLPHALTRGARIYAEVLGFAASADAYHLVAPDPSGAGASKAIRWALSDARVSTEDIDYISAHATSTDAGDAAEIVAIKKVFGERAYRIPISSAKSMIGHAIGAAGALEAVASVLTIRDGKIHPTINQRTPDPRCDLDTVPNFARTQRVDTVLSNSFGFGGQNACLVLRRFESTPGSS